MSDKTLGQIGYEAYYAFTGGKTFDNRDMPTWQQIKEREGGTPRVTAAWEAASEAIYASTSSFCRCLHPMKSTEPRCPDCGHWFKCHHMRSGEV